MWPCIMFSTQSRVSACCMPFASSIKLFITPSSLLLDFDRLGGSLHARLYENTSHPPPHTSNPQRRVVAINHSFRSQPFPDTCRPGAFPGWRGPPPPPAPTLPCSSWQMIQGVSVSMLVCCACSLKKKKKKKKKNNDWCNIHVVCLSGVLVL